MAAPTTDQILSPRGGADPAKLDPMARFVLSQVDGLATIADIAEASGIPAELACRIADALVRDGHAALPGADGAAGYADPEVAAEAGAGGGGADSDSLEADVDGFAAEMGKLNYYEMLSVEPDADRKALRSAFFVKSKRYHPDRAFGPRRAELRDRMSVIFTRLSKAYETLANADERAAYDAYIAGQIELWKIERQLTEAAEMSKLNAAQKAATPTPEPAAPTRSSTPAAVVTRTRSSTPGAAARPRAVVTSIPPERRPPEKVARLDPPRPEDSLERRSQWKKERLGRAFGRVMSVTPTAAGPSPRELEQLVERAAMAIEVGKNADAVNILKDVLEKRGDMPRARDMLRQAEAGAMKELSLGYLRQARYQRSHGDPETARAHFEKVLSIDPTSLDARHQLAEMLIEHKLDLRRALTLCREVIGLGGQRAKYFVTLGEILLLSKDREHAAEAFERALSLEPDNKELKKKLKACKG
jgi:tetratricopeptide (TPR) repeat protein